MPAKAVQVSLERDMLQRIDRDPEARKKGRSAFIRKAVDRYLRAKARRRLDDRLRRAYAGQQDAMGDEVAGLVELQAWPKT